MAVAWLDADWPAPRNVRAFTTVRHGLGVSAGPFDRFNLGNAVAVDGDDPAAVARNRALLVEHAALPRAPHWLRQVHGVAVCRFDKPVDAARDKVGAHAGPHSSPLPRAGAGAEATYGSLLPRAGEGAQRAHEGAGSDEPSADASVTSTPGHVLAILTADCLPVLLCADDGSEVAAAHAGWRGLAAGVLEATVSAMHTPPARVIAWLGPAAGPQHYEVGVEVYDAFVAPDWSAGRAFTSTRPHHWHVDLYALARQRLAKAGLAPGNVHGGGLCTIADPQRFYSHRRDRRTGRMASLIWIEPGR